MSYTSQADLGGHDVPGRIVPEREGELFHGDWEARALALTLAMGATGAWNLDMGRSARETLPGYAGLSYYEIWFEALQKLVLERGLAQPAEWETGVVRTPGPALPRLLEAADVGRVLAAGAPTARPATRPPAFAAGDPVRTRAVGVMHHTRLPGYACGRLGHVERAHGMHVFPDANAHGLGEQPQWLYTVVFDAEALWGEAAATGVQVSVDAWESYLEPAA